MEEQTNTQTNNKHISDWLKKEAEEVDKQPNYNGEKLPALQFEEGKIVKFSVDFSEPFKEYNDQENKTLKAIIPISQNGEKKILWLNKRNPLYKDLIHGGREGQTEFKVMQTGSKANTKYNLVRE